MHNITPSTVYTRSSTELARERTHCVSAAAAAACCVRIRALQSKRADRARALYFKHRNRASISPATDVIEVYTLYIVCKGRRACWPEKCSRGTGNNNNTHTQHINRCCIAHSTQVKSKSSRNDVVVDVLASGVPLSPSAARSPARPARNIMCIQY